MAEPKTVTLELTPAEAIGAANMLNFNVEGDSDEYANRISDKIRRQYNDQTE